MKTGEIDEPGPAWFFLRSEKDRGREDALKPQNQASVVRPILWQVEEIEHLKGSIKVDVATFLLHGESGNPDGNQPILAEGQAVIRVPNDSESESTVLPGILQ